MSSGSNARSALIFRGLVWAGIAASLLAGGWGLLVWSSARGARTPEALGALDAAPSPPTALLLGSLALGLLHPKAPGRLRRAVGMACAGGVVAMGITALFQGQGLGLTQAILVLLGCALLVLGRHSLLHSGRMEVFILPALCATLLVFNSLLHGALKSAEAPDLLSSAGLELQSAAGLLLLGIGVLCARPEQGLMVRITRNTLGGFLARRLVPVTLLSPTLFSLLLAVLERFTLLGPLMKAPLFSTVATSGGVGLVLISTAMVDRIVLKRRHASTALAASEARYRGLLETAPDPVVVMDRRGVLHLANDRTEQVFGYSREELIGRNVEVLIPERLRKSYQRNFEAYMLAPVVRSVGQEVSLHGRRKDGSELPVEVSLSPYLTAEGLMVTAIIRDVTERELHLNRLQQAHRELERLQQEYVGIISHDLRNPLQVIALRTHMLQRMLEEKGLTREAHLASGLLRNTQRMGGMVEELLDNSRLEAGQVELRWQPTDLARFLDEVLERDIPPDSRERFRLKTAEVPPVPVDPPRLERVLVNLLTNALKYSLPGTPITVRLERTESHAEISVQDQGQGMRPEDTGRLFEKYYRTREGRLAQGIGLGLYISRLIVEAHGGRIRVASNPGQGSIFTITLPLKLAAREESATKLGAA
ncbi:MAG: PAS domain S-box protein [Myxococcaceae bacterium]|nr:PAS domain S-box protein [Myxococcaceae bacterium]